MTGKDPDAAGVVIGFNCPRGVSGCGRREGAWPTKSQLNRHFQLVPCVIYSVSNGAKPVDPSSQGYTGYTESNITWYEGPSLAFAILMLRR